MSSSIFWKRSCTIGTNFSSNVRSRSSVQQSGPGDIFLWEWGYSFNLKIESFKYYQVISHWMIMVACVFVRYWSVSSKLSDVYVQICLWYFLIHEIIISIILNVLRSVLWPRIWYMICGHLKKLCVLLMWVEYQNFINANTLVDGVAFFCVFADVCVQLFYQLLREECWCLQL